MMRPVWLAGRGLPWSDGCPLRSSGACMCYRHDYLVMDRRSTATLIYDGGSQELLSYAGRLSRSVIGLAGPPGGGSKQIAE